MKTIYSFELWDICGTSFAPFPFDAPRWTLKTRCTPSSLNSYDVYPATVPQAQYGLAPIEQKVGQPEQCPTSALA